MSYTVLAHVTTGQLATASAQNSLIDDLAVLKTSIANDGSVSGPLKGYHETVQALTIVAGVVTIDYSLGNHVTVPLNANITSFVVTNLPATSKAAAIVLYFTADGTLRTITHSLNGHTAKFGSGNTPTMTSTNGKIDKLVYSTIDGGSTFMAEVMAQNE